ncbi:hypothetical protein ASZ78_006661 [Callipepla squamata]|uniref:SOCS box domain-containing protein n=1 Tax=Callipepla squamata TaxID=9009 RepID=A0A226NEN0_CALSU|nr:hypothetical protein ASZ78_006661 [Callipepla squamata]
MTTNTAAQGSQNLPKRRLESIGECPAKRKASWGILTSQGMDHICRRFRKMKGHSECLEVLISWGIDVDQDLPHLGTPLYVACVSQQIHCIRKLLYAGANVQKGKHLETPLHAAAQHSSTEIVNLLLEFGADINAKNTDFERPVDLAAPRSLVERLLLLHEATPSSLCQLCRLRIRNYIGRARLHLVPQLQLPTILKNFLQYR